MRHSVLSLPSNLQCISGAARAMDGSGNIFLVLRLDSRPLSVRMSIIGDFLDI